MVTRSIRKANPRLVRQALNQPRRPRKTLPTRRDVVPRKRPKLLGGAWQSRPPSLESGDFRLGFLNPAALRIEMLPLLSGQIIERPDCSEVQYDIQQGQCQGDLLSYPY
jgi:hypothetical protein